MGAEGNHRRRGAAESPARRLVPTWDPSNPRRLLRPAARGQSSPPGARRRVPEAGCRIPPYPYSGRHGCPTVGSVPASWTLTLLRSPGRKRTHPSHRRSMSPLTHGPTRSGTRRPGQASKGRGPRRCPWTSGVLGRWTAASPRLRDRLRTDPPRLPRLRPQAANGGDGCRPRANASPATIAHRPSISGTSGQRAGRTPLGGVSRDALSGHSE